MMTDKEYQPMGDAAFLVNPHCGRRDRRLQHSVRGRTTGWAHGGDRNEPQPLTQPGAGIQSYRLPYRQNPETRVLSQM